MSMQFQQVPNPFGYSHELLLGKYQVMDVQKDTPLGPFFMTTGLEAQPKGFYEVDATQELKKDQTILLMDKVNKHDWITQ